MRTFHGLMMSNYKQDLEEVSELFRNHLQSLSGTTNGITVPDTFLPVLHGWVLRKIRSSQASLASLFCSYCSSSHPHLDHTMNVYVHPIEGKERFVEICGASAIWAHLNKKE